MNDALLEPTDPNAGIIRRMAVAAGVIALGFGTVGWRLYDLQITRHSDVSQRVANLHKSTRSLLAARGPIRDANGELLAHDKPVYDLWVDTFRIRRLPDVKNRLAKIEKETGGTGFKQWSAQQMLEHYAGHVATVLTELMIPDASERAAKQLDVESKHNYPG